VKPSVCGNQIVKEIAPHLGRNWLSCLGDDAREKELWRASDELDTNEDDDKGNPNYGKHDSEANPAVEFGSHTRTAA
jgi:hypothetical protein